MPATLERQLSVDTQTVSAPRKTRPAVTVTREEPVPRRRQGVPKIENLEQLHAIMGHYAKLLHDLQQERIRISNRLRAMRELVDEGLPEEALTQAELLEDTFK